MYAATSKITAQQLLHSISATGSASVVIRTCMYMRMLYQLCVLLSNMYDCKIVHSMAQLKYVQSWGSACLRRCRLDSTEFIHLWNTMLNTSYCVFKLLFVKSELGKNVGC